MHLPKLFSHWAVDTLRAIPWIGPSPIAWMEDCAPHVARLAATTGVPLERRCEPMSLPRPIRQPRYSIPHKPPSKKVTGRRPLSRQSGSRRNKGRAPGRFPTYRGFALSPASPPTRRPRSTGRSCEARRWSGGFPTSKMLPRCDGYRGSLTSTWRPVSKIPSR